VLQCWGVRYVLCWNDFASRMDGVESFARLNTGLRMR
jgi:hypothetical protein